jgi:hypothetical protein
MMEFHLGTERCFDCDGHWRHFEGCPWYKGEPALGLVERVAVMAAVLDD